MYFGDDAEIYVDGLVSFVSNNKRINMKLITRKDLGWPASAAPDQASTSGVKVHYEGTKVNAVTHDKCKGRWTQIRNSHLANAAEGYSDVAYNFAVCQHGYVLEGRGLGKRTGANGNQSLNKAHYAVVVLIGSEGDTKPSAAAVTALREVIQYLRKNGAGKEIKGHRDGFPTACPGGPLYELVKAGKLEPGTPSPPSKPKPVYAPFPGTSFFKYGKSHSLFKAVGKRLVAEGFKGYKVGPSETWGPADERGIKWFQQKQGWSGSDADGKVGPETWKRLRVPKT